MRIHRCMFQDGVILVRSAWAEGRGRPAVPQAGSAVLIVLRCFLQGVSILAVVRLSAAFLAGVFKSEGAIEHSRGELSEKDVDATVPQQRWPPTSQPVPKVEVPEIQPIEKVAGSTEPQQRQVPMIQPVQKVAVPENQSMEERVGAPVLKQRQAPMAQTIQRLIEVPETEYVDSRAYAPPCAGGGHGPARAPGRTSASATLRGGF